MPIDYFSASERYRPVAIRTLLVGEAPPPSGKTYFYVPRDIQTTRPIENNATLPATVFNHYFRALPRSVDEYHEFLMRLRADGVFVADICEEPIRVRGSETGLQRIILEIPMLRARLFAGWPASSLRFIFDNSILIGRSGISSASFCAAASVRDHEPVSNAMLDAWPQRCKGARVC